MRIGVLAHVSGNSMALAAADRVFTAQSVEARVCLGNIVGIYPFLQECIEFLVDRRYTVVKSFVDDTFSRGGPYDFWTTRHLVDALQYCRRVVPETCIHFLRALHLDGQLGDVRLVSQFEGLEGNRYVNTSHEAVQAFGCFSERVILHAGVREANIVYDSECRRSETQVNAFIGFGTHPVRTDARCLISSGGIGSQYRGPGEPSVAVYDDVRHTLDVLRVQWNAEGLFQALEASNYPGVVLEAIRQIEYGSGRV